MLLLLLLLLQGLLPVRGVWVGRELGMLGRGSSWSGSGCGRLLGGLLRGLLTGALAHGLLPLSNGAGMVHPLLAPEAADLYKHCHSLQTNSDQGRRARMLTFLEAFMHVPVAVCWTHCAGHKEMQVPRLQEGMG